jgi:ABC-type multidrug transport system ATPase subunit
VEDVSTLCSRFAIINEGEVLYTGTPDGAIEEISGKVYGRSVAKNEVQQYKANFQVISTQLRAGQLYIRVYSESDPGNGFIRVVPNLEDVYFRNIGEKAAIANY